MSLPKFGAFLLLCLCCNFSFGATVNQEREELSSLKRNLSRQEDKAANLKAEIQNLPDALAKAQDDFNKAEAEYLPEKESFTKIKAEHASSPSANTERQLKLAEIKFGLAERRYEKAKEDLTELQNKESSLTKELATAENAIKNGQAQIKRQEQRLADAIANEAKLKREAEIAKEEQERKARLAVTKPVIEPPKADIAVSAPAPVPTPVAQPAPVSNIVELTKDEVKELEFAKEKMASLEKAVASASAKDNPTYNNLQLSGPNFDGIPFQHLGAEQYRTDVTLHPGEHSFRIETLRFDVDVPGKFADAQDYVFLVDASDRNRLKASYFRKDLLKYFDKEIAIVQPQLSFAEKVAKAGIIETPDGIFMSEQDYKEFKFAKEKMSDTDELIASASSNDSPNITDLTLRNTDLGDVTFSYLGNQQYRADKALPSGRHTFRIERLRFNIEVPDSAAAQDYIFIVDARDKNNLRASYFRRSLLDYIGKEVAVAQ